MNMQQVSIFDVFEDMEKENRLPDVLSLAEQHDPGCNVVAVYIPSLDMRGAFPAYIVNTDNKYRYFQVYNHKFPIDRTTPLMSHHPDVLNKHWTILYWLQGHISTKI